MDSTFALVAVIVIIALTFDYTNGFNDAANSIATVVSTRALSPARGDAWGILQFHSLLSGHARRRQDRCVVSVAERESKLARAFTGDVLF